MYLMRHKSRSFEKFKKFKAEAEWKLNKHIKAFRSDRGGKYLSGEFKDYLTQEGIVSQLTAPQTPQQNDVSERRNHTLLDIRSMMSHASIPLSFGGFALETAAYILNMVPSKQDSYGDRSSRSNELRCPSSTNLRIHFRLMCPRRRCQGKYCWK